MWFGEKLEGLLKGPRKLNIVEKNKNLWLDFILKNLVKETVKMPY